MIFATIGTQASFDRLVKMLDEICEGMKEEVIVQTIKSEYTPKNVKCVDFLPPDIFAQYFNRARLVIAHAGMGTILSAMKQDKPIIVVPRLASLNEHRNDHQIATAMRMNELGYVYVAYDKKQLKDLILQKKLMPLKRIGEKASESLETSLKEFIDK